MEEKRPTEHRQQQTADERVREFVDILVGDWRPSEQQILQWIRIAGAVGSILLTVLLILYVIGLLFDITLLNLLKVLAIPITVGAAVPLLNWLQKKRELDVENQRAQDEALQRYLDQISQLLLEKDLRTSDGDSAVRTLARARTLTVLWSLNGSRKGSLLEFLYESRLIIKETTLIKETTVIDLKRAHLADAHLREANLHGAHLREADLHGADLAKANLSEANLSEANLSEANLSEANLIYADLSKANLSSADLRKAHLRANLSGADLSYANLSGVSLKSLRRATLKEANLTNAKVTREQLEACRHIEGATMPDGSKHP